MHINIQKQKISAKKYQKVVKKYLTMWRRGYIIQTSKTTTPLKPELHKYTPGLKGEYPKVKRSYLL